MSASFYHRPYDTHLYRRKSLETQRSNAHSNQHSNTGTETRDQLGGRTFTGEKQRLAIARVLYHKPKYCILDECTSGVSTVMEKRLYHLLNAQGISYITISHRPMLKAMHCKSLLILGDKDRNYEFRELQSREDLMRRLKKDNTISPRGSSLNKNTKSTEQRITELQDKRSERYNFISKQKDQAKERMRKAFRNVGMISNLVRILKGAMPKGCVSKLLTIFGGIALKALLADLSLFNIAGLFRALFTRDANLLYVVLPSTPTSPPPSTTTTTQVSTHDRRCRDRSCRECSEFVHSIHTEQSSGRSVGDSDWKVHEEVCLNKRILQSEKH